MGKKFAVGTPVAYTHAFLVSTAAHDLADRRGIVSARPTMNNFCHVKWSDGATSVVAEKNLVAVDRMHLEAYYCPQRTEP